MCLAVLETFGILFMLRMLNVIGSLCSVWIHPHLYHWLGRVYGVRIGRRGSGGGGLVGGHHAEDVEAGGHNAVDAEAGGYGVEDVEAGQGEDVV